MSAPPRNARCSITARAPEGAALEAGQAFERARQRGDVQTLSARVGRCRAAQQVSARQAGQRLAVVAEPEQRVGQGQVGLRQQIRVAYRLRPLQHVLRRCPRRHQVQRHQLRTPDAETQGGDFHLVAQRRRFLQCLLVAGERFGALPAADAAV
ncbi:hypothetical protein [Janthinobacterium sp. SUN033]|uniref:hypothetical protein n=1 Tax=Janthinobacterium sp. SUN033 TaxID=3002439 RepID=UPI0025B0CF3E|nr:hypothetical protein [Janthinobacterium sp. SUN033]MDN2677029.1 hypothetical protein [Janthinobacterium sp. SUN033]